MSATSAAPARGPHPLTEQALSVVRRWRADPAASRDAAAQEMAQGPFGGIRSRLGRLGRSDERLMRREISLLFREHERATRTVDRFVLRHHAVGIDNLRRFEAAFAQFDSQDPTLPRLAASAADMRTAISRSIAADPQLTEHMRYQLRDALHDPAKPLPSAAPAPPPRRGFAALRERLQGQAAADQVATYIANLTRHLPPERRYDTSITVTPVIAEARDRYMQAYGSYLRALDHSRHPQANPLVVDTTPLVATGLDLRAAAQELLGMGASVNDLITLQEHVHDGITVQRVTSQLDRAVHHHLAQPPMATAEAVAASTPRSAATASAAGPLAPPAGGRRASRGTPKFPGLDAAARNRRTATLNQQPQPGDSRLRPGAASRR